MNRWIPSILIVGSLIFGLSRCNSDKEFNGEGIITNISPTEINVTSVVPNPLRTTMRECNVTHINELEVKCVEQKNNVTFTHSVKIKDIADKDLDTLSVGSPKFLRLPLLNTFSLDVHKQYVYIHPYETQVGINVFLNGKYKDDKVKIKGVYKSPPSSTSISVITPTPNNIPSNEVIKVCVPNNFLNNNNQLTFEFFRQEGKDIIKYEIMQPNVQVDKVDSGYALEEPGMKLLMMSNNLTVVEGYETITNTRNCVNPSNTTVPPYRSKSVAAMSNNNNTTQNVKQNKGGSDSTIWAGLSLIRFILFVVFNIIGFLWMISWL